MTKEKGDFQMNCHEPGLTKEDENTHPHLNPLPEGEEITLPFKGRGRACPELVSGVGMGFSDHLIQEELYDKEIYNFRNRYSFHWHIIVYPLSLRRHCL